MAALKRPLLLFSVCILSSCATSDPRISTRTAREFHDSKIRRLALLPASYVRQPAETSSSLTLLMTEKLYESLVKKSPWQIVSPEEIKTAILRSRRERIRAGDWRAQAGGAVFADSVLFAEILSARQRVGGEYGADRAASIHFMVSLLNVNAQKVTWQAEYQETQKPLTQDLLAVFDSSRRAFRWLTLNEIMAIGIEKTTTSLIEEAARGQP